MLLSISRPSPGSGLKATGRDISQTSSCFIEKGQWGKEKHTVEQAWDPGVPTLRPGLTSPLSVYILCSPYTYVYLLVFSIMNVFIIPRK